MWEWDVAMVQRTFETRRETRAARAVVAAFRAASMPLLPLISSTVSADTLR